MSEIKQLRAVIDTPIQRNHFKPRIRLPDVAPEPEDPKEPQRTHSARLDKTPYDVALRRGITREDTPDQRHKNEADMRAFMDRHMRALEEPGSDEHVSS